MRRSPAQQFYATLSRRSRLLLDATIFCLFGPIGIASDIMSLGTQHWVSIAAMVLMSGGIAIIYARAGFTGHVARYVTIGVVVQVSVILWLRAASLDGPLPVTLDADGIAATRQRLQIDVALLIGFIVVGYSMFIALWNTEGKRYFLQNSEIRLAQRIHQKLVPDLRGVAREIEWAGFSRASGDIGGDLVDAFEGPAGLVGCVADVSGHGVGAGLLMGMFKTAFRAAAEETSEPSEILARTHVTLAGLTEPNMYITAAAIRVHGRQLHIAGGGHPPVLLYRQRDGQVEQIDSTGPAIALLDDFNCRTVERTLEAGDVALLLTDGITEASGSDGDEVGVAGVTRALSAHASAPLDLLLARVGALATHGARADDQTLLAIRAL